MNLFKPWSSSLLVFATLQDVVVGQIEGDIMGMTCEEIYNEYGYDAPDIIQLLGMECPLNDAVNIKHEMYYVWDRMWSNQLEMYKILVSY